MLLLPCDHEVTGLSPGKKPIAEMQEMAMYKRPKWSDP